ncbi:MAPEG family protein [Hydrogenophaga sp. 5NK40-0174]|uniref:MAPEG family protein n=1 Tax=Hydrogenophaga sp. 5NK40-0174 TaxID=3127649 RepID=UPI003341DDF8
MPSSLPLILYVLFIAAMLPIGLAMIGGTLRTRAMGKLDNNHPRAQQAQLTGMPARVYAAQANAWESLAVFSACILIAHASGLDLHLLNTAAIGYLVMRLLHAAFYTFDQASLRSLAYAGSKVFCVQIFYLAFKNAG